jgi:SWIM zinc finger
MNSQQFEHLKHDVKDQARFDRAQVIASTNSIIRIPTWRVQTQTDPDVYYTVTQSMPDGLITCECAAFHFGTVEDGTPLCKHILAVAVKETS